MKFSLGPVEGSVVPDRAGHSGFIGVLGLGPINLEGYITLGYVVEECIMFMPSDMFVVGYMYRAYV